jgi:endonuclease III
MVALGEELDDYIKTIGLYRNKAKNVIALASGSGMAAWCRARARN